MMSNSREQRQANLTRMSSELITHAKQLGVPSELSALATKSADNFVKICDARHLVSKANQDVPLKEDCDEVVLGTTNDVFFYVAPFRCPKSNCGLLFSQTLEEAHRESGIATPFDSGGSVNDFVTRHELPIPEHRQYLDQGMTALSNQPLEYVNGTPPIDPVIQYIKPEHRFLLRFLM